MRASRAPLDALLVGLSRALISAACLWSGFRAISDDDYARVTIAARFAASPALDPSGTSWLPLPFWLYGAPMWLFGDSLTTARGVAFALGVASALLVWLSARLLGLDERAALLGALGAALLPYGAWLSVASVPEAPCAALILLGAASLSRSEGKWRVLGGLSLGAACLCRYEAWAAALAFGLLCGWQGLRERRRDSTLAAAAALTPMALWLLHGVARHGDALFFVRRVSSYREALGHEPAGVLHGLWQTPYALVRFEPELTAVAAVALVLSLRGAQLPFAPGAWKPAAVLGALLGFLMLADATGSSATHHPERALLSVFWFLALVAAGLVSRLASQPQRAWLLSAVPLALLGNLLLRPAVRESFVERGEEEQVGSLLRHLAARDVALDTDDFGYFAIQAALGHGRGRPLSERDPRNPEPRPSTPEALANELRQRGARWLVTTRQRAPLASALGARRAATARFVVVELTARAP